MARINGNRVTHEIYENTERLARVRHQFYRVFESLKDTDRVYIVNAAGTIEEIQEKIEKIVSNI
jgi:thymidylate kinase